MGFTSAAAITLAAYGEIAANGTRRARVYELGFFAQTAVAASKTILGRPGNTPTTGTQTVGSPLDPQDAAPVTSWIAAGWGTAPTAPSAINTMRQFDFPATIGSAYIATWDIFAPLVVGPTRTNVTGFIVWNGGSGTGPSLSVYAKFDE
jgi:hypothetical protein